VKMLRDRMRGSIGLRVARAIIRQGVSFDRRSVGIHRRFHTLVIRGASLLARLWNAAARNIRRAKRPEEAP